MSHHVVAYFVIAAVYFALSIAGILTGEELVKTVGSAAISLIYLWFAMSLV